MLEEGVKGPPPTGAEGVLGPLDISGCGVFGPGILKIFSKLLIYHSYIDFYYFSRTSTCYYSSKLVECEINYNESRHFVKEFV